MKTKINWKVRFKNKTWLLMFLSLIVGFIFNMLNLFDIYPSFSKNQVVEIISEVLTFLGLIGVLVDPTTSGIGDSERALNYEEPWKDEEDSEPDPYEEEEGEDQK